MTDPAAPLALMVLIICLVLWPRIFYLEMLAWFSKSKFLIEIRKDPRLQGFSDKSLIRMYRGAMILLIATFTWLVIDTCS